MEEPSTKANLRRSSRLLCKRRLLIATEGSFDDQEASKRNVAFSHSDDSMKLKVRHTAACKEEAKILANKNIFTVRRILNEHLYKEETLNYLRHLQNSQLLVAYNRGDRKLLLRLSTTGVLEGDNGLYRTLADYVKENKNSLVPLQIKEHKRDYELAVLLPEAINYCLMKEFTISYKKANRIRIMGLDKPE